MVFGEALARGSSSPQNEGMSRKASFEALQRKEQERRREEEERRRQQEKQKAGNWGPYKNKDQFLSMHFS